MEDLLSALRPRLNGRGLLVSWRQLTDRARQVGTQWQPAGNLNPNRQTCHWLIFDNLKLSYIISARDKA